MPASPPKTRIFDATFIAGFSGSQSTPSQVRVEILVEYIQPKNSV